MSESRVAARRIREIILHQSKRANVGHIGSALSVADLLAVLYTDVLRIADPRDPERDRFILSKGHASLALYAALSLRGWISRQVLDSFCQDGSILGVHPDRAVPGVDFSTGSLGQGLSMGVGAALAARLADRPHRVFVLVSDAECNTGVLWEAVMFAAHHRLSNLIVIVDSNGQQALGYTKDVLDIAPLAERWRAFGWDTQDIDGHDTEGIARAIEAISKGPGAPHVLVARTVFGKGVSYMEGQIKWHYWPMSDEEYARALAEVESRP
ncbi:MAG TPA: transketolase [Thermoanaerobaculia bacterium]